MIYKSRSKPIELQMLEYLQKRMNLTTKDQKYYFNLKKGYEGEKQFDLLIEKLQCDCLVLNDLLLRVNNYSFQIDSLIITSQSIYLVEVKNYDGDYYYESDKFFKLPQIEIVNPLHQLSRNESLLRQLFFNHGYNNLPIDASVVFINSEFTLYNSPRNKPIIHPTQIKRYLKKLSNIPSKINSKHKMLADKLISLHISDSPYNQLPNYRYDQLEKGITCFNCQSLSIFIRGYKCICKSCGFDEEKVSDAIIRSVKETKLLFPDYKITTAIIYNWCKVVPTKKRISYALNQHYNIVRNRRWAYFE